MVTLGNASLTLLTLTKFSFFFFCFNYFTRLLNTHRLLLPSSTCQLQNFAPRTAYPHVSCVHQQHFFFCFCSGGFSRYVNTTLHTLHLLVHPHLGPSSSRSQRVCSKHYPAKGKSHQARRHLHVSHSIVLPALECGSWSTARAIIIPALSSSGTSENGMHSGKNGG